MKKLALACLVLLAIVAIGIVWWTRDNLDGLVKDALEAQGSAMTGVSVTVDKVRLSAAEGQGEIHGLVIGNPPGFKTGHALKVTTIRVRLDVASVLQPIVRIHEILVEAPDVIYEKLDAQTNFDAIQANVQRSSTTTEKPAREVETRLQVDRFELRNATAHASAGFLQGETAGISLPDIVLKDIGRNGGVTPAELGQIIATAMKQKLSLAYSFDRALRAASGALDKAGDAVKSLFK